MTQYDVIICGAGPAGSVAATLIARAGYSVLLVDKQSFPRDKVCGDQLPPLGMELLTNMNILDISFFNQTNEINTAKIIGPKGSKVKIKFNLLHDNTKICTIPRKILDYKIYKTAIDSGADFCEGKVTGIRRFEDSIAVTIQEESGVIEKKGKVLFGADGSTSTIARLSNLNPGRSTAIAIRGYIKGLKMDKQTMECFFLKDIYQRYAWVFPISDKIANIGLGISASKYKIRKINLFNQLQNFAEKQAIKSGVKNDYSLDSIGVSPLSMGPPKWHQLVSDRIMLIGDAAGLVNPFTGGGTASAILSGKLAAEVVTDKLKINDLSVNTLSEYVIKVKRYINREYQYSNLINHLLSMIPGSIDWLINIAGKNDGLFRLYSRIFEDVEVKNMTIAETGAMT